MYTLVRLRRDVGAIDGPYCVKGSSTQRVFVRAASTFKISAVKETGAGEEVVGPPKTSSASDTDMSADHQARRHDAAHNAMESRASDIHIENMNATCR